MRKKHICHTFKIYYMSQGYEDFYFSNYWGFNKN